MMVMVEVDNLYTCLGQSLRFPHNDIMPQVNECIDILEKEQYPKEILKELRSFKNDVERLTLEELQELYSYTFEFTSETTLDMGWYSHEGFKRAQNLLTIKSMYRDQGFPFDDVAKGELPDNLAVILFFIGHLTNEELKINFVKTYVIMSLEKLNRNFQTKKNAYRHLINAVYRVLDKDIKDIKEVS